MKRLHSFFVLPSREKRLIILSLFIVFAVRLSLSFLPFSLAKKLISAVTHAPLLTFTDPVTTDRIAHAVSVVGRCIPRSTCLVRAMAASVLLSLYGQSSSLRIGVRRVGAGGIEAHAWVECEDGVIIGGKGDGSFTPLPSLDRARS